MTVLGTFPKAFSEGQLPKFQFPKWELPECTISQAVASQRLGQVLGKLPLEKLNIWEVSTWEVGVPAWEKAFGKVAHIFDEVKVDQFMIHDEN